MSPDLPSSLRALVRNNDEYMYMYTMLVIAHVLDCPGHQNHMWVGCNAAIYMYMMQSQADPWHWSSPERLRHAESVPLYELLAWIIIRRV